MLQLISFNLNMHIMSELKEQNISMDALFQGHDDALHTPFDGA